MRKLRIAGLALLLLCCSLAKAQTGVRITYYDGTVQTINVSTDGKLFFQSDNLAVKPDAVTAATIIPVTIIRKVTFVTATAPLPVTTISNFAVAAGNCKTTATWQSGTEVNLTNYQLEYGTSSTALTSSITKTPTGSNSTYSVDVPNLNGTYFYRLKINNSDGSFNYSSVLSNTVSCVTTTPTPTPTTPIVTPGDYTIIYPNPANDVIRVKTNNTGSMILRVINSLGQVVKQGTCKANDPIDISHLAAGVYTVQINGTNTKLIIQ